MGKSGFPNEFARDLYKAGCADFLESREICPICGDTRFIHKRNPRTGRIEAKYSCGLILELGEGGGITLGAACRHHELDWLRAIADEQRELAIASADLEIIKLEGGADG